MHHISIATTLGVVLAMPALWAQNRMTPATPGTVGDPQWQAVTRLTDGRVFVTDGGLAIDAGLAKLPKLPEKEYPRETHRDVSGDAARAGIRIRRSESRGWRQ